MQQWQIGDVKITRIVEMEIAGGTKFILPDATPEACADINWLQPHFMNEKGELIMSIHALVVETPEMKIIVDTCIGNDKQRAIPAWTNLQTSFLEDLKAAGYDRESIDVVMCTHLHVDHVGWNTMLVDGEWVPTFPNARYLMAKEEWEYWDTAGDDGFGPVIEDSVRPIVAAGLHELVAMDHQVTDEVALEPTPGHTPGHVSVRIRSGDGDALITGDFVHHPCQMARTDWSSSADYDSAAGVATRERVFAEYADSDTLIIGTHFATPTAGKLKRDGEAFWLDVRDGVAVTKRGL